MKISSYLPTPASSRTRRASDLKMAPWGSLCAVRGRQKKSNPALLRRRDASALRSARAPSARAVDAAVCLHVTVDSRLRETKQVGSLAHRHTASAGAAMFDERDGGSDTTHALMVDLRLHARRGRRLRGRVERGVPLAAARVMRHCARRCWERDCDGVAIQGAPVPVQRERRLGAWLLFITNNVGATATGGHSVSGSTPNRSYG